MGEAGAICFDKNHGSVREEEEKRRREERNLVRLKSRFLNNKRPGAARPGAIIAIARMLHFGGGST